MALEKVLALDATGVIEKEIDTGGSGGGDYGFPITITVTDANSITSGGCYNLAFPHTNGPTATFYHIWHSQAGSTATQVAVESSSYPSTAKMYSRSKGTGGVWTAWAELVLGDGIKVETLCETIITNTKILSPWSPLYYKPKIGAAWLALCGNPYIGNPLMYGDNSHVNTTAGTGASISHIAGSATFTTGTTATGYATFEYNFRPPISAVAAPSPYSPIVALASLPYYMAQMVIFTLSALSTATDRFTALIVLLGGGPATNTAVVATTSGISISYTDSENSGKFVISYRNTAGVLAVINTSIAPSIVTTAPTKIEVRLVRLTSSTATVTVIIDGTSFDLVGHSAATNLSYSASAARLRMLKSIGTTSRSMSVRTLAMAWASPH